MAIIAKNFLTGDVNQFAMNAWRGQRVEFGFGGVVATAVVDSTETGTLLPGDAVTIVGTSKGVLHVKKAAAATDVRFGFVAYNAKDINATYKKGSYISVCSSYTLVNMVTDEAIAAGTTVYYDPADGGITATSTSMGNSVGIAYEAASSAVAAGQIIRVLVKTV
jgi:hypothetical protein